MVFTDQMGRNVELTGVPKRIVSLVPSQSEFLWDLGLQKELVGITKFCIHPDEMFRSVAKVGGTKKLDLQKIAELKPDLIIGNKEENEQEQIEELAKKFPVWMSDIINIDHALNMMEQLSAITDKKEQGLKIVAEARESLRKCNNIFDGRSAAYFMWNDPYMCAGGNTFIGKMMEHLGIKNVIDENERYPVVLAPDLKRLNPPICLLSTEPFPFSEKHVQELKQILQDSKIVIVDGEMFSWYGSRLRGIGEYFRKFIL